MPGLSGLLPLAFMHSRCQRILCRGSRGTMSCSFVHLNFCTSICGQMDVKTNHWTVQQMNGWTDGRTDGRKNGWTDGQMDGRKISPAFYRKSIWGRWPAYSQQNHKTPKSRAKVLLTIHCSWTIVWVCSVCNAGVVQAVWDFLLLEPEHIIHRARERTLQL